jgi:hypothetical protein
MTKFQDIIEKCGKHQKVLVTGPQRSGTTFAAKSIAKILRYRFVDEDEYQVHDANAFIDILKLNQKIVIHAPAMSHLLPLNFSDTFVIWMQRNIMDVIKSEDKIDWHIREFWNEKNKAIRRFPFHTSIIEAFPNNKLMKDWIWDNLQKVKMYNYAELNYKHLRECEGFIKSKTKKQFWNDKQTN